jgi:hypothetical protein
VAQGRTLAEQVRGVADEGSLESLIQMPREAQRMMNLYRMLRSTRGPS